ncbi:MAG: hypothetical protein K6T71_08615 [Candidatus Bipolaricaulota bacterium]|nr:hypothetical protein [Candidatus Bipolaricaulota bacterium]
MTADDRLFEEIFRGELEIHHREHPGFSVLWDYAASRLEPELAEKISLHLASCGHCATELREIRAERRALIDSVSRLRPDPLERLSLVRGLAERARGVLERGRERLLTPRVFYRHAPAEHGVGLARPGEGQDRARAALAELDRIREAIRRGLISDLTREMLDWFRSHGWLASG